VGLHSWEALAGGILGVGCIVFLHLVFGVLGWMMMTMMDGFML
jgi:hypothetical protein